MQRFSYLIFKEKIKIKIKIVSFSSKLSSQSKLVTPIPEATHLHYGFYDKLIESCKSDDGNQKFWGALAENRIKWFEKFSKVSEIDFPNGINKWFINGKLNASVNCIDRHVEANPNKTAIIWEKDEPGQVEKLTYKELLHLTCQIANLLKEQNVQKHDVVILYMPNSPILVACMLACARIGAAHSVIFGGFSPSVIASRIINTKAKIIVTTDQGVRGGKVIDLKKNVDEAIILCPENTIKSVLVHKRTGNTSIPMSKIDLDMDKYLSNMPVECKPEIMDADDMLFILYTSGSSGAPKGLVHSTAGYLLYAGFTFQQVFDFRPDQDVFGCVADLGWITGHSYIAYGPLFNGGTTLIFESTPTYPNPGRYWELVERLKLTQIYLAPTALRLLIQHGDEWVKKYDKSSLRVLGCVGEPLNTEAWKWFYELVGERRCDIVDTWWQTETGGIILSPRPSGQGDPIRPGMPMRPFPGIEPVLMDLETNQVIKTNEGYGALLLKRSWPGISKTIFGDHDRFVNTYFKKYPGYFFTGDGSHRYSDGSYQITGRIDDVINTGGHRIGTAELEDVLDRHECVSEAAVVGFSHPVKGEGIYAFITLKNAYNHYLDEGNGKLIRQLINQLKALTREHLATYAAPDFILIAPGLPKTRSGKIIRRILKKISSNDFDNLGDISTLSNPEAVEILISTHKKIQEN